MKIRWTCILFITVLFSCNPEEIGPQSDLDYFAGTPHGVLISNEGNFNFGNASLSFYDPYKKEVYQNVYEQVNGEGIGDVLQDVLVTEDKIFLVVNNSGKVIVTDKNLKKLDEITGFDSPRYIQLIDGNRAYVSNLFSSELTIVDLATSSITGTIDLIEGWSKEIFHFEDKAIVLDDYANSIKTISTTTDQLITQLSMEGKYMDAVYDGFDRIYIYTQSQDGQEIRKFQEVDLNTNVKTTIGSYTNLIDVSQIVIGTNPQNDFFLASIVNESLVVFYKIGNEWSEDIQHFELPIENAYEMTYDDINNEFYICDPQNFVQAGKVYRYSFEGELIDVIDAGAIPNGVVFNE